MTFTSAQILRRAVQKRVERIDDPAADAVLDRHQAVVDVPAHDFVEHAGNIAQRNMRDAAAELLHRSGVGEGSGRPEKADPQRLFQRERAAHQFAIDRLQAAVRQRPMVQPSDLFQHHFLAIGRIDRRVVLLLDLADLHHHAARALSRSTI